MTRVDAALHAPSDSTRIRSVNALTSCPSTLCARVHSACHDTRVSLHANGFAFDVLNCHSYLEGTSHNARSTDTGGNVAVAKKTARKAPARKAAAKKAVKKAPARKAAAKKTAKRPAKKAAAKKAVRKAPARKAAAKKAPARKTAARRPARKATRRR